MQTFKRVCHNFNCCAVFSSLYFFSFTLKFVIFPLKFVEKFLFNSFRRIRFKATKRYWLWYSYSFHLVLLCCVWCRFYCTALIKAKQFVRNLIKFKKSDNHIRCGRRENKLSSIEINNNTCESNAGSGVLRLVILFSVCVCVRRVAWFR